MPAVTNFSGIQAGDALVCLTFRADRVRQLLRALLIPGTPGYQDLGLSAALAMAPYADDIDAQMQILFQKEDLRDTLSRNGCQGGKTQFHVAETENTPMSPFS